MIDLDQIRKRNEERREHIGVEHFTTGPYQRRILLWRSAEAMRQFTDNAYVRTVDDIDALIAEVERLNAFIQEVATSAQSWRRRSGIVPRKEDVKEDVKP